MSLYDAHFKAAYRQGELLHEAEMKSLERMAREGSEDSISDRPSAARLVALLVTVAIIILGGAAVASGFDAGAVLGAVG